MTDTDQRIVTSARAFFSAGQRIVTSVRAFFSAGQLGSVLGKSKRAVQLALRNVKPDGAMTIRGQLADAWSVRSLPSRYVQELDAIAEKCGYRNAEHLLQNPPRRFAPRDAAGRVVPLSQISESCVTRAVRRRSALALAMQQIVRDGTWDEFALQHYRRDFGNASERHFRRLIKRTLQRDAGEEHFDDLAIYFDDIVTRKRAAQDRMPIARTAADRTVLDALNSVRNPSKPTSDENALIWTVCCEYVADAVGSGEKQKRAQSRVLGLLAKSGVAIARTPEALRKNFKRKYQSWWTGGQKLTALQDSRPLTSGFNRAPEPTESDRLKLIGHARFVCGGDISRAWRELLQGGELSVDLAGYYLNNSRSKSYVPRAIRKAIARDVKVLDAYHHGPREHKLRGAHHTRDWSGVAAGEWFQSDDLTAPVYFYKQTERRNELTRGQFLPMIDERTTKILGFVLIQERNYNSLDIRSLITLVCSEHGLPRKGFSFERGIWKSSKILTGKRGFDLQGEADMGLRRLGMRFRHAQLPRGKVIERTIGQIQDLMESLPGYCGRDERLDRFERFQRIKLDVEAGRAKAEEHFLSAEEILLAFQNIVHQYNAEPQQGRKLNGLSPNDGWNVLQGTEPRIRYQADLLYFLASDVRKLKIGRNGITVTIGKKWFNYKGQETGKRQGEIVYAWFNPQRPETLACTTGLSGSDVFTVERSYETPAVDASPQQLHEENRKIAAHNGYAPSLYHVVKNSLPSNAFRRFNAVGAAERLGAEMESQHKEISERQKSEERLHRAIVRRSKRAGISSILVPTAPESLEPLGEFPQAIAALEEKAKEGL
jgi:hypothetical protein